MKNLRFLSILLLTSIFTFPLFAQGDASALLEKLQSKMDLVNDYQAEVEVEVDVSFINMPDKKGTIFFKKPDKFHFETKGFSLLPKKGLGPASMNVLDMEYQATFLKDDTIHGKTLKVVNIIPLNTGDENDIIMVRMWIDEASLQLLRIKTFSENSGSFTVDFIYANHQYDLPDKMVVAFNIKNQKLPVSLTGDYESLGEKTAQGSSTGRVVINYLNYTVNQGIPDSIFE